MATLSSIPESNPSSSNPKRQASRGRSIASFEKPRPRSRVILLSRRPTRIRRSKHRSKSETKDTSIAANDTSKHTDDTGKGSNISKAPQKLANPRGSRRTRLPPAGSISDLDLLSYERLVPALNTESFAHNPQLKKAIPITSRHGSFDFNTPPFEKPGKKLSQEYRVQLGEPGQHRKMPHHEQRVNQTASRARIGDGMVGTTSSQTMSGVDEQLIQAVTRNVVQQLQLFSFTGQASSEGNVSQYSDQSSFCPVDFSQTSSQKAALNRFTHELQQYAEQTNAKGKLPVFTPTPVKSGCTLRTVSELLPFRPEFTAAGLAVTSQDQAHLRHHPTKASIVRATRRRPIKSKFQHPRVSQLDGNDASGTTTTEISFLSPKDGNDWRFACLEEVPPKKKQSGHKTTSSLSRCIPCFQNSDDHTTDGECPPNFNDPFEKSGAATMQSTRTVFPQTPAKTSNPKGRYPPNSPPDTCSLSIQETIFDVDPSRARAEEPARSPVRVNAEKQHPRPAFFAGPRPSVRTTGRRRPSMTLPWQNLTAEPSDIKNPIEKGGGVRPLRHYPTMPPGPLNPRRASHRYRRRDKAKLAISSPKRYQSLPAKQIVKDLSKMPRDHASLPNLNSARRQSVRPKPSADLVAEPPPTRRASTIVKKTPTESPKRSGIKSTVFIPQRHVPLCARGSVGGLSIRPKIPRRTSSIQGNLYFLALQSQQDIEDRDVLKGLHIAASAACDEQVDAFIRQQTGLQIRRFLADLMAFENLGDEKLGEDIKERVLRRRSEMKKLKQQVRRSREISKAGFIRT